MKYTKLKEIQNTYPGDVTNIESLYNTKDGKIRLNGKYPKNFLTFNIIKYDNASLGTINTDPDINIRFLVKFIDGDNDVSNDFWTSESFLADLRDANQKSNPYFNRETVTVAEVDFQSLREYWRSDKFVGAIGTKEVDGTGEKYAEVEITNTIDTKKDMFLHIDWLTSTAKIDEPLREVSEFGSWNLVTTPSLGFDDTFFTGFTADNPFGGGRGRDGDGVNIDDRTPGTDRDGNTVTTVTPDGTTTRSGDSTRVPGDSDTTTRTTTTDRDGNTVTTVTTTTSDGTRSTTTRTTRI